MDRYTINSLNKNINWNAKGKERIVQNIVNILNTIRYEVAYDRTFGRNPEFIDQNFSNIKGQVIAETYDLITEYEPRAAIISVDAYQISSGEIDIKVVVDV